MKGDEWPSGGGMFQGEGAAWHQLGEGMPGVSQDHQAGDLTFSVTALAAVWRRRVEQAGVEAVD